MTNLNQKYDGTYLKKKFIPKSNIDLKYFFQKSIEFPIKFFKVFSLGFCALIPKFLKHKNISYIKHKKSLQELADIIKKEISE